MDELIKEFKKAIEGDDEASNNLYRALKSFGLRIASNFSHTIEDSEDIVHTALERFYKAMRQFNGYTQAQLLLYFKQICVNVCKDFLKNQHDTLELGENVHSSKDSIEDKITIKELIRDLTLEERQLFILKMKGHSEKEIAGILKIQAGTVASRWYRIMEKIKNKI